MGHVGLKGFVLQGNSVFVLPLSLWERGEWLFLFFLCLLAVMMSNNQDWPELHPQTDVCWTGKSEKVGPTVSEVAQWKRTENTDNYCRICVEPGGLKVMRRHQGNQERKRLSSSLFRKQKKVWNLVTAELREYGAEWNDQRRCDRCVNARPS